MAELVTNSVDPVLVLQRLLMLVCPTINYINLLPYFDKYLFGNIQMIYFDYQFSIYIQYSRYLMCLP